MIKKIEAAKKKTSPQKQWENILQATAQRAGQSRENALKPKPDFSAQTPEESLAGKWRMRKESSELRNQIKAWNARPDSEVKNRELKRLNLELAGKLEGLEAYRDLEEQKSAEKWQQILSGMKSQADRSRLPNWTVFYYASAGDRMEEIRVKKLLELESIGSSKDMNLLAQIDRGEEYLTIREHGGKAGATRYKLEKSDAPNRIISPEVKHFGQVNASDPAVLQDFLSWGMKKYPAEHYLIMVQGHGAGMTGLLADHGKEAKAEKHELMSVPEFAGAINGAEESAGVDKDQVVLDLRSCLVGTAELAYELKDSAAMLVDSQAVLYPTYWRIGDILGDKEAAGLDPEQMAQRISQVNSTEKGIRKPMATSSLVDLKQVPELKKAVVAFEKAVQAGPESKERLKDLLEVKSRPNFYDDTAVSFYASDFYELARSIAEDKQIKDPKVKTAAKNLQTALDKVVVEHSKWEDDPAFNKNANGMGITTASSPRIYRQTRYRDLAFDKDTGWSEFMTSYAPGAVRGQSARLDDAVLKPPRMSEIARLAGEALEDAAGLDNDIELAQSRIKDFQADSSLTPLERSRNCRAAVKAIGSLNRIALVSGKPWFQPGANRPEKVEDQPIPQAMDSFIHELAIDGAADPEILPLVVKTGLLALSELEGEISSATLSDAARTLLAAKEKLDPKLKEKLGQELLLLLAKATRNDRVIAYKKPLGRTS